MSPLDRTTLVLAGFVSAILIYVYPLFLPTPLLEPDEGLHATISQEMLENGEWIVPRLRGEPFPDKPILYFWAQMASLRTFGMTEFSVRFPGLMFGLLASATTGLFASRLYRPRTGLLAFLMSMTMIIPLSLAQAAAHDVALVPWTNLALLCLFETERSARRSGQFLWLLASAAAISLAILTKALLGVALVAVAFAPFLLLSRRLTIASAFRFSVAVIAGMILASPWYFAMELRSSGYLYYYFVERHLLGFATASQPHGHEPWYYYVPFIALGALPWLWYIVPLLRDEWTAARSTEQRLPQQVVLLLSWLVGGLLFLSVAGSKLVTYSLPLFPALAILSAEAWQRYVSRGLSTVSRVWFARMTRFLGAFGILVPVAALLICGYLTDSAWPPVSWLIAVVLSVVSVAAWRAFERENGVRCVSICSIWVAGLAVLMMTWPLQKFADGYSERGLAEWINRRGSLPQHLILIGEEPSSVVFYLNRELRKGLQPEQFSSMPIEQMPTDESLAEGVVLAVTERSLRNANLPDFRIPGAIRKSAGGFLIFENGDGFLTLVEAAWRAR
ncbi:MAG: glycosyltransferase family 39 protein [Planctomycetaceae bacterium]